MRSHGCGQVGWESALAVCGPSVRSEESVEFESGVVLLKLAQSGDASCGPTELSSDSTRTIPSLLAAKSGEFKASLTRTSITRI